MGTITCHLQTDMRDDEGRIQSFDIYELNNSRLIYTNGYNGFKFFGNNFSYSGQRGIISSGTVTSFDRIIILDFYENPIIYEVVYSATEFKFSANEASEIIKLARNFQEYFLSGNDKIIGSNFSDYLIGYDGDDVISGGHGNDTFVGGRGFDIADYSNFTSNVRIDLNKTTEQYIGDEGYETLREIEGLMGGSGADTLTGDNGTNTLVGNRGNDSLFGLAGNDTLSGGWGHDALDGGVGADKMFGGAGNDTYYINTSGDRVYETATSSSTDATDLGGTDTAISCIGHTLGKFIENLTLTGTTNAAGTGNELANTLVGNDGANTLKGLAGNDILKGGTGNDKLHGGAGKDTLTGGTGKDSFVFDTAPTSRDTITDFSHAQGDKIQLSKAVFKGFTYTGALHAGDFYAAAGATKAHDATDRLIYNTTTGILYYDADGLGGAAAVQVAQLGASTHPTLAYGDLMIIA